MSSGFLLHWRIGARSTLHVLCRLCINIYHIEWMYNSDRNVRALHDGERMCWR